MNISELYVKTIFCCMACDGKIAPEEVSLIYNITSKHSVFNNMNVGNLINKYIEQINSDGKEFINQYFNDLKSQNLSIEEQDNILDFVLKTINADSMVAYSEIRFFKKIRMQFPCTDEHILSNHPDIEDILLPDIVIPDSLEWNNMTFNNIDFNNFKIQ